MNDKATDKNECNIHTRFRIGRQIVLVVNEKESEAELVQVSQVEANLIKKVVFGSAEHVDALSEAINKLRFAITANTVDLSPKSVEILKKQLDQRQNEYDFLVQNHCESIEDNFDYEDGWAESEKEPEGTTLLDNVLVNEDVILHVTSGEFGTITALKLIEMPRHTSLIQPPYVRQWYLDGVLHREKGKMHVPWY
jgi:hypothetical protein